MMKLFNLNFNKTVVNGVGVYFVLFFGLVLRLFSLNQSLWLDEATSALVSKMSLSDMFAKFLPGDFHPPLYYLILKYWVLVFGSSEISLRIPSVIFGLATVYVVYRIGKTIFDEKVGLIAASFVSASGLLIYYSQEARMYALAAFLVSLSIYLFINKKWFYFSIAILLLGMTDYVSLFVLPVFLLADYKNWKKILISFGALGVGFMVWLPVFVRQLAGGLSVKGSNWWNILGTASFKNIALIPVKFAIGRIGFANHYVYALVVGLVLLTFGYLLFRSLGKSKLLWYWLIIPILIGVIVSLKIPTLTYFRFLFTLPAMYLLISKGITSLGKYTKIFFGIILVFNIVTSVYYLTNYSFQREDWRDAVKAIGNDIVVFPADSQKEALTYYGKGGQIVVINDFEPKYTEVWLSRYVSDIVDPGNLTPKKLEALGYNKTAEYNFNGVVFWKYVKNKYAYLP